MSRFGSSLYNVCIFAFVADSRLKSLVTCEPNDYPQITQISPIKRQLRTPLGQASIS